MKLNNLGRFVILGVAMTAACCKTIIAADDMGDSASVEKVHTPPISAQQPVQPCYGAAYLSYTYPGYDVCPCDSDGCFHPARYHCDCGTYRKHWWRTWLRAHFKGGSMQELYPCHCMQPQVGRPYLARFPLPTEETDQSNEPTESEANNSNATNSP